MPLIATFTAKDGRDDAARELLTAYAPWIVHKREPRC